MLNLKSSNSWNDKLKEWLNLPLLKKIKSAPGVMMWLTFRLWNFDKLFFTVVFTPTLISTLYYGIIASGVYVSESQFVVRGSQNQSISGLGVIFGGAFTSSQHDSYSVNAFMVSRDVVKQLEQRISLKEKYSSKNIDIFNRFAGLTFWQNSLDNLHYYYQDYISVYLDMATSISVLKVKAYTADDAYRINEELLHLGEGFVNKLNTRARADVLEFSSREMAAAEEQARVTSQAFTDYRKKSAQFDQAEYEKLLVEKSLALKQLEARHLALVQARDEARKQELYLDRIVQPNVPDFATEPKRLKSIFSVLILGLVLWGILTMVVAGVREHYD